MKGIPRFPLLIAFTFPLLVAACVSVPPVVRTSDGLARGAAREVEGNYAAAMEEYREALYSLDAESDRLPVYLKLARCAMKLKDYRQAREYFKRAENVSDSAAVRFETARGIGEAFYQEGRYILAETHFLECERYEKNPLVLDEIYYKLAVCYQKIGKEPAAAAFHAKVAKYRPATGDPSYQPWSASTEDGGEATAREYGNEALRVFDRSDWHARPIRRNYDAMGRITRLTIHHSAMRENSKDFESCAREIQGIQEIHQGNTLGWADIGYHYLIDRAGRIWEGRPIYIQGAHAGNPEANRGNIGVCLLGDYTQQDLTSEQKLALRELLINLMNVWSIPSDRLYTHQEMRRAYGLGATECPGDHLQSYFAALRAEMRRDFRPGQRLARNAEIFHLVHHGETLYRISQHYGVTLADLRRANLLSADQDLEVGQRLRIPR